MAKFNQKKFDKKRRVKELKPKDGYNRFKFMGKVFRYREEDIFVLYHDPFGEYVTEYGAVVNCEDGRTYDVVFRKRNGEYVPFSISDRYVLFLK